VLEERPLPNPILFIRSCDARSPAEGREPKEPPTDDSSADIALEELITLGDPSSKPRVDPTPRVHHHTG
jgi:hypothetical protein